MLVRVALPTTSPFTASHIANVHSLLQKERHENEINKKPVDWDRFALMICVHNGAGLQEW